MRKSMNTSCVCGVLPVTAPPLLMANSGTGTVVGLPVYTASDGTAGVTEPSAWVNCTCTPVICAEGVAGVPGVVPGTVPAGGVGAGGITSEPSCSVLLWPGGVSWLVMAGTVTGVPDAESVIAAGMTFTTIGLNVNVW